MSVNPGTGTTEDVRKFNEQSTPKLCTSCIYHVRGHSTPRDFCFHPVNCITSRVDGGTRTLHDPAFLRSPVGRCGAQARLFEAKPPKLGWLRRLFGASR